MENYLKSNMKITHFDLLYSIKAYFKNINEKIINVNCDDYKSIERTVNNIQIDLDRIKERIEVGKRIGTGDNLEPIVVFTPEK